MRVEVGNRERWIVIVLSVLFCALRVYGVSQSIWDWDEALFRLAVGSYDVAAHHPHPPGFPLYVGAARLLTLIGLSPDGAFVLINLVAGSLLFPAAWYFFRAAGADRVTGVGGAALFASLPNVSFYAGTRFSDIPALACLLVASAVLLHSRTSRRAFLPGVLLFALGLGIRPQNLLMAAPLLVASCARRRQPRLLAGAAALVILIVGVAYGAAAMATGPQRYVETVRLHRDYIVRVDSYKSPIRPPISELLSKFTWEPFSAGDRSEVLAVFALIGLIAALVRRDRAVLLVLATFLPYFLVALTSLDHWSISRFSVAYMPLLALLAASGVATLVRPLPARGGRVLAAVLVGLLAVSFVEWTLPALRIVRNSDSPPVAAMKWIAAHPAPGRIYVDASTLDPFASIYLTDEDVVAVGNASELPLEMSATRGYAVVEGEFPDLGRVFEREADRLRNLVRRRYFAVTVVRLDHVFAFGEDWHGAEGTQESAWRWMGRTGSLVVGPGAEVRTMLIEGEVPLDALASAPEVVITIAERPVARFEPSTRRFSAALRIPPSSAPVTLRITTSGVVPPRAEQGGDPRELGLRVNRIALTD